MKLIRFHDHDTARPAVLDPDGLVRDASSVVPDYTPETLESARFQRLLRTDPADLPEAGPIADHRLAAPVSRPGKIIAIGRNYAEHAKESGAELPDEPMIFMKAPSALSGPDDPIERPRGADALDWEVELAVVIGARAKYIRESAALDHVLGYSIMNDVSERTFQKRRAGQFTKGKSHDTFAPLGPFILTRDELPDPHALRLTTRVDGELRQDGTTADMVFDVPHLVAYLSRFMTLEAGDIIATGTPAGVAMGQDPPPYLQPGQTVALAIEHLGTQTHRIIDARP